MGDEGGDHGPASPPAAAAAAEGVHQEEEAAGGGRPCVLVRGFPESWQSHQVRLIFAVFGGTAAVRIAEDGRGGRSARVELKNPENMQKAVDQLHGTQVGDGELIEECTISCELLGGVSCAGSNGVAGRAAAAVEPVPRSVFVDELPMPARPDVKPGTADREVFLQSLPVRDCSEEQIRAWLEGFGGVEDVHLLRDHLSGDPNGKGYVRFATHAEAAACVEAQASISEAEDGDVVAHWSESERAMQHRSSVYGYDVHNAFHQRALDTVRTGAKVPSLWMLSERRRPEEAGAPMPEARQLHFVADCTGEEQFAELRARLSKVLEDFHRRVARPSPTAAEKGKEGAWQPPVVAKKGTGNNAANWRPAQPLQQGHPADHWRGGAPPPHAPHASQGDRWRGPPPGTWGYPPSWQPPDDRGGERAPEGRPEGGHPSSDRPLSDRQKERPPLHDHRRMPPKAEEAPLAEKAAAAAEAPPAPSDSVQSKIDRGEALVREARQTVEKGGPSKKAYEKYCRGLQSLLDVMPRLPEDDAAAQGLRVRVDGYLEEAERLKAKLDAEGRAAAAQAGGGGAANGGGGGGAGARSGDRDRGGDAGARGGGKPSQPSRAPAPSTGGSGPADGREPADKKAKLRSQLERGDALIHEGRAAEDRGALEEAYEKYCKGLQCVLEVMPQLGEDNPQVGQLRGKVSNYLERAERLKEKLEKDGAGAGGVGGSRGDRSRQPSSAQGPDRGGGGGVAPPGTGGGGARSRSRHRHKHRSPSRSRRHGHGRDRHRTRSRSRGGRKDGPQPSPPSRSSGGGGGRGGGGGGPAAAAAPGPPPPSRPQSSPSRPKAPTPPPGNPPDEAPRAEAARTKATAPPPRPSPTPPSATGPSTGATVPAGASLIRPKSGSALLVGKASVKR